MKQMVCSVCSYTYDEAVGIPEAGIAPGTGWEDLPEDWKCPWCGAGKDAFREKSETDDTPDISEPEEIHVEKQLSAMEMSVICSNLARGCEKQYMPEQEKSFRQLARFFRSKAEDVQNCSVSEILGTLEKELEKGYPYVRKTAEEKNDRGDLRALIWSERVTRMLQSLLTRYEEQGDKMLENTGVYVCTVCGFVYIGDEAPDTCPVCKVPGWKFDKIERGM